MSRHECTEDLFLKDVSGHAMEVIRDDGVHRHLRFRKPRPAGSEYWFDLITWPEMLCIDGDMGTYVFRRLDDMFQFFRTDREYNKDRGRKLGINLGYWSEKLRAPDSRAAEEYSADKFRQYVKEAFAQWVEQTQPDDDASDDERAAFDTEKVALWGEIEDDVLCAADDGEIRAHDSATGFEGRRWNFSFSDAWEWDCRDYTFHFVWCCYAIAWGIEIYDEHKAKGGTP